MKSQVLHTQWCDSSGETGREIWNWSFLGVKGLTLKISYSLYQRANARNVSNIFLTDSGACGHCCQPSVPSQQPRSQPCTLWHIVQDLVLRLSSSFVLGLSERPENGACIRNVCTMQNVSHSVIQATRIPKRSRTVNACPAKFHDSWLAFPGFTTCIITSCHLTVMWRQRLAISSSFYHHTAHAHASTGTLALPGPCSIRNSWRHSGLASLLVVCGSWLLLLGSCHIWDGESHHKVIDTRLGQCIGKNILQNSGRYTSLWSLRIAPWACDFPSSTNPKRQTSLCAFSEPRYAGFPVVET